MNPVRLLKSFATAESKSSWIIWRWFEYQLRRQRRVNEAFDLKYGTDTASEISLEAAGVTQGNVKRGNSVYRPFWEKNFKDVLALLPVKAENYTIVDIGSGKGKLLLLASHYPFKKIVGLEYAPLLHQIAERNIQIFRSPEQKCRDITALLGDALEYRLPPEPVICMIYNALDQETMRIVLTNLEDDARRGNSPVFIIYANLRHVSEIGGAVHGLKHLQILHTTRKLIVLGNAPAVECWRGPGRAGRRQAVGQGEPLHQV